MILPAQNVLKAQNVSGPGEETRLVTCMPISNKLPGCRLRTLSQLHGIGLAFHMSGSTPQARNNVLSNVMNSCRRRSICSCGEFDTRQPCPYHGTWLRADSSFACPCLHILRVSVFIRNLAFDAGGVISTILLSSTGFWSCLGSGNPTS